MPIKTFSKENRLQEPQNTELKGTTIENGLRIQGSKEDMNKTSRNFEKLGMNSHMMSTKTQMYSCM